MRWWHDGQSQTFSLAGYAGTGKTTVISRLIKTFNDRVLIAAPTGKAAQRLREKGVDACTIHQLAYRIAGHDEDGNPEFDFIGLGGGKKLVIIDEASMVDQVIYNDLVGGGYRMLFVGDHGQLPPVGDDPGIMRKPTFALSIIHRQDDKGLLDFAHALRNGVVPARVAVEGDAVQKIGIDPRGEQPAVLDTLRDADVVLCWMNKTRHWLNHRIMQLRGLLPDAVPYEPAREGAPGNVLEVLGVLRGKLFPAVCLRNDHRNRVFNGQLFDVQINRVRGQSIDAVLFDDVGRQRDVLLDLNGFRLDRRGYSPAPRHLLFDFGACLTTHKSQGSEWPWVCVWDDTHTRMDERARWAYTAATRAQRRLTWLHR